MSIQRFCLTLVGLLCLAFPAFAQSATYHLERLQIQARDFLEHLPAPAPTSDTLSVPLDEQLNASNTNSSWSRQMVIDDVKKIVETSRELTVTLAQPTPENLLAARGTLDALARRLRVSSSALNLTPEAKTSLDFLMLELEESQNVADLQREQIVAQSQKRQRTSWQANVGFGGYWGSPYGWGSYYPYGYGFGYQTPYSRAYGGFGGYGGGRVYGIGPRGGICR